MIEHDGRRYVISRKPITDSHGNHHGWFCRVQSEDGRWRIVTVKHKLEKFPLQASDEGLVSFIDEMTEGLMAGSLIAEPRPDSHGDPTGTVGSERTLPAPRDIRPLVPTRTTSGSTSSSNANRYGEGATISARR